MSRKIIYSFLILLVNKQLVNAEKFNKCCEYEMEFKNGSYSCKSSTEIQTNLIRISSVYDILDNSSDCVDIWDQSVSVFRKKSLNFIKITNTKVLTKCCPLSYFYNHQKRTCVKLLKKNNSFDSDLIKIGLPQCEVISDLILNLETDAVYNDTLTVVGSGEVFLENEFCLDETIDARDVVRICRTWRICKKFKCIRKCCRDGKSFVNGSHCEDTFIYGLEFDKFWNFIGDLKDDFAIAHGYPSSVYLEPDISMFYLDEKGNFYNKKTDTMFTLKEEPYCIEHGTKNGINYGHSYFGFLISDNPPLARKFLWNRAAMIVSAAFLIFTIIFYLVSGETRKVFGKTLICFCLSLLLLYSILIYHTFNTTLHFKPTKSLCKVLGFIIIYLGFCSFVWLQILCYDIYCTFGTSSRHLIKIEKKKRDLLKLVYYCLYGWGLPLAYTGLLAIFHVTEFLPYPIELKMAVTRCAIEKGQYAEILFRAIPLTIIEIFNLIFFIKTVIYVLNVKKEIQKMVETPSTLKKRRKFDKRTERFGLVVKLSFTMGVFYLFEVISSFFDFNDYEATATIEIIWDFINCLQGLFIFLIFVCKRRNYVKFKKSNAVERIRKISLSTSRKTSVTVLNINNCS